MGVELQGSAVEQLRAIAQMTYGSNEGIKGGAGNIGMIGNHVVKFNTHWTERFGPVTSDMRASSDALKAKIVDLVEDAFRDIGIWDDHQIQADVKALLNESGKSLLERKVVARVLNRVEQELSDIKAAKVPDVTIDEDIDAHPEFKLWKDVGKTASSDGVRTDFASVKTQTHAQVQLEKGQLFVRAKSTFPRMSEAESRHQTDQFVESPLQSLTFTARASKEHVRDANAELARVYPADDYSAEPIADDDLKAWNAIDEQFQKDVTRNFSLIVGGKLYGRCPLDAPGARERFAEYGATKMTGKLNSLYAFVPEDQRLLRNQLKELFTRNGTVDWRMLRQFCASIHQGSIVDLFTTAENNKTAPIPYGVQPTSMADKYDQNKYMVAMRDEAGNIRLTFDSLDKPTLLMGTPGGDGVLKLDEDRSGLQRKATVVFSPGQPPRVEEGSVEYSAHLVKGKFAPPPPALERINA